MKILTKTIIKIIKFYQYLISPLLGNNCRYLPTCSEYFIGCLKEYGLIKGFFKGTKRVISCQHIKLLGGGEGFEPVKKIKTKNGLK